MRKKVEFELLSPVVCGGVRIADNFLESENFIRGSVLRAAFANDILLECPLADLPGRNGELNYIEEKEPSGKCAACPNKKVCRTFSEMYFSFAYPEDSLPAPFTLKACKTAGLKHHPLDTIYQNGRLSCPDCKDGLKRMESVKGFIRQNSDGYSATKIDRVLTTHTAINYDTHTAEDGNLFTLKALPKGLIFTAEIDDCDTGMLYEGKVIYVGKYASAGCGKIRIRAIKDTDDVTEEMILSDIHKFQNELSAHGKASILFLSDAILDIPVSREPLKREEYMSIWHNALFGADESSVKVEKVFAEMQLYSGFDTSRQWGEWKDKEPVLMIQKGTSILLDISDENSAVPTLMKILTNGVGERSKDGFGAVAICHQLHRLGVSDNG